MSRPGSNGFFALLRTNLQSDGGALRQRLDAAGVPITQDDAAIGVHRFYALDPFGNRLEFIEHADRGFTDRR